MAVRVTYIVKCDIRFCDQAVRSSTSSANVRALARQQGWGVGSWYDGRYRDVCPGHRKGGPAWV